MWSSSEENNNNAANKILEVRCFRHAAEVPHAQRPEAPLREGMHGVSLRGALETSESPQKPPLATPFQAESGS